MLRMNYDSHSKRSLEWIFFVKQKMFLESKELPFSQSWDNYTLTLSIGIFNTQS